LSYVLHRLPAVANIMLTQDYLEFAQQVMSTHDKANKQAELDVSASMGEMLQDMQACLKQLCGSSAIQDPEAVARLIAEKVTAMNMSSDSVPKDSGKALALPAPAAKREMLQQVLPIAQQICKFSKGGPDSGFKLRTRCTSRKTGGTEQTEKEPPQGGDATQRHQNCRQRSMQ